MQDFCVLGLKDFLFFSTPLGVSKQGISIFISFALSIINLEVVSWQLLSPPDLSGAQAFYIHKALEVVVVYEHENFILATFQIVSPSLECFNHCQQLSIVGLISSLCRNHLSGKKSYRILSVQIIWGQLTENPTNNIAQNIRLNLDMTLRIKMIEYWGFNKCLPQFGKSFPSVSNKKRTWLAEVPSSGGFCFFGMDLLFGLGCFLTFLAFTTFLYWFFFTLIFHLNSLITLLWIFAYWTCC